MKLIDRQDAIDAIDLSRVQNTHEDPRWSMAHEHEHRHFMKVLYDLPAVDAVPIEWINQRVKGLKIQLINADEDDVDLIWHLRDEIQTLTELIDYWKEEQEKQNGTD